MKTRVVDPSKIGNAKDAALRKHMKSFGKYNAQKDAPKLREQLKPIYKSIERHEAKTVKESREVKSMKGKMNYFKHLAARARMRGENE